MIRPLSLLPPLLLALTSAHAQDLERYRLRAHVAHGEARTRTTGHLELRAGAKAVRASLRLGGTWTGALTRNGDRLTFDATLHAERRGARGAVDATPASSAADRVHRLTLRLLTDGFLRFRLERGETTTSGWGVRAPARRVLVILPAADTLRLTDPGPDGVVGKGLHRPLVGGSEVGTGFALRDLVRVAASLRAAGFAVELATPGGQRPTVDVNHLDPDAPDEVRAGQRLLGQLRFSKPCPKTPASVRRFVAQLRAGNARLKPIPPRSLAEVATPRALERYAGVFFPGGRAAAVDLAHDAQVAAVLRHCRARRKPTGLNAHAVMALLSTLKVAWTDVSADAHAAAWPYRGAQVAAYHGGEEVLVERLGHHRGAGRLPFHVDEVLERFGARTRYGWIPTRSYTRQDRELITGQNPASIAALGAAFTRAVRAWHAAETKRRLARFEARTR